MVETGFPAGYATFSPDGRWFAYCEADIGTDEVYVQPYPSDGTRVRISTAGGASPQWSHDGRQIVYTTLDNDVMLVEVEPNSRGLRVGAPRKLFTASNLFEHRGLVFDSVRARILLRAGRHDVLNPPINVVVNWTEELRASVRAR